MTPYDVLKIEKSMNGTCRCCGLHSGRDQHREGGMACISLHITRTNETSAIGHRYFSVSELLAEIDW
jgi:hypothetical protein